MARSTPISQVEIEEEMLRLLDMLEKETEAFEQLSIDAAKKDAIYKSEWAKQYLSANSNANLPNLPPIIELICS